MKKFIKIFAVLLAFCMLIGCAGKKDAKVSLTMTPEEKAVAKDLRILYADMNESNLYACVFNLNYQMIEVMLKDLSVLFHGATLKEITVKEIDELEEFKIYAVAAYFSGGAKSMIINDVLLIGENNQKNYVILQEMYSKKAQADIVDAYITYQPFYTKFFNACNKTYADIKPVTSIFSIRGTENNFTNEAGQTVCGTSGLIYDFTITLDDINRGVTGTPDEEVDVAVDEIYFADIDTPPSKLSDGRELVWDLEFNGDDISLLSGALTTSVDTMYSRSEFLKTSTSNQNYFLEDGSLVMRITKDPTRNVYTTARSLSTSGKMSYKYGYVEMRAIVPYSLGVWPSFWMQPDKKMKESTLYNGEIDIFESFGSGSPTVSFNLHKWFNGYKGSDTVGKRGNYEGSLNYSFKGSYDINKEYHIYGFEWTKDFMKVYIDGECYYQISIKEEDDYSTEHPGMDLFHDYYYLCWNNWLYVSQAEKGNIVAPADYKIDYVRLYQHKNSEYIKVY